MPRTLRTPAREKSHHFRLALEIDHWRQRKNGLRHKKTGCLGVQTIRFAKPRSPPRTNRSSLQESCKPPLETAVEPIKMTERTTNSQLDAGKTGASRRAKTNVATATLSKPNGKTETNFKLPSDGTAFFSRLTYWVRIIIESVYSLWTWRRLSWAWGPATTCSMLHTYFCNKEGNLSLFSMMKLQRENRIPFGR